MLQGPGHSKYWSVSSTSPAIGASGPGGYHLWQMTSVGWPHLYGSGFGPVQAIWEWIQAFWSLLWTCRTCSTGQMLATQRIAHVLQQPVFQTARMAVRETAVQPQMRDPHYWREVSRIAKAWQWSENVYRRLDANERADRMLRERGSTATHMVRELAVELAYGELKAMGR